MSGVEDWSGRDGPDELRIRLEVAPRDDAALREEPAQVKAGNLYVRARLSKTAPTAPAALPPVAGFVPATPAVDADGPPLGWMNDATGNQRQS